MDFLDFARTIFALTITLGLIAGAAWAFRKYAPEWLEKLQAERGARRLKVVETLVLDPTRRLVLVTFDDRERLFLLGEGSEMAPASAAQPKAKPRPGPGAPKTAAQSTAPPGPSAALEDNKTLAGSLARVIARRSARK